MALRVLLSAGEVSGENYAADLIRALKDLDPTVEIAGYGGSRMEQAGMKLEVNLLEHSVMGIVRVLKKAPTFLRILADIRTHLDEWQPDVVVPIDYPGLHFVLSKYARKRNIPVVFYVSPQLWAWAGWRIYKVRRRVSRMLVILPFEEEFYARRGVEVTFVGHPLFDYLRGLQLDETLIPRLRGNRKGPLIALLPGSRRQEISNNLPTLLLAAKKLATRFEGSTFVIANPGQNPDHVQLLKHLLEESGVPGVQLHLGSPYEIMSEADVALVTSGTATIELTFFETPMVVIYRTTWLNARLGKMLTKTNHIALVNILAGKEVVPEHLTSRECSNEIADEAAAILGDSSIREAMVGELQRVRASMGGQGASLRAAEVILRAARGETQDVISAR